MKYERITNRYNEPIGLSGCDIGDENYKGQCSEMKVIPDRGIGGKLRSPVFGEIDHISIRLDTLEKELGTLFEKIEPITLLDDTKDIGCAAKEKEEPPRTRLIESLVSINYTVQRLVKKVSEINSRIEL